MFEKLSVIIVGPEIRSRSKLREVLNAVIFKGSLELSTSLTSTSDSLTRRDTPLDVLFLDAAFGMEKLAEFFSGRRSEINGHPYSTVVYFSHKDRNMTGDVADLFLSGCDGFISEPFSASEVSALLDAMFAKRASGKAPEKVGKAAEFVLTEASAAIHELAKRRRRGDRGGGYAAQSVKLLRDRLHHLAERDPERYLEAMERVFAKASPIDAAEQRARARPGSAPEVKHPGAYLRRRMQKSGVSRDKLLEPGRIEAPVLDALLADQGTLDEPTARELARLLGMTAKEWLDLQRRYDAAQAVTKDSGDAEKK